MKAATKLQLDTLTEIFNIGIGRAASSLNEMLNSLIELEVPYVHLLKPGDSLEALTELTDEPLSVVHLDFEGAFTGSSSLVFPAESAANLVKVLTGSEADVVGFEALVSGTLTEVGNIVINGVMGSISNMLSTSFEYSIPLYREGNLGAVFGSEELQKNAVLIIKASFMVKSLQVDGHIFIVFEVDSFDNLLEALDNLYGGQ